MCKELSSNQLTNYINGIATNDVTEHIVHCADCRQTVARKAHAIDQFGQLLHPNRCPDEQELGEYFLNTLADDRAFAIYLHCMDCSSCQQRLAQLGQFIESETQPQMIMYPMVRNVSQGLSMAFRSAGQRESTDLTYKINEAEINLAIRDGIANHINRSVWGLVTGIQIDETFSAELQNSHGDSQAITNVDSLGGFLFEDVAVGEYQLAVHSEEITYILRGLELF